MKEILIKNKTIIILSLILLLLGVIGVSYAFMSSDVVVTTEGNANVQVIAGDGYTFEHIRNIEKLTEVSGTDYTLLDMSSDITLTALEQIDTTYDLYYNIKVNNYLEGTTTSSAKVIVKIYNPSGAEVTSLTGLSRVTVGSITGFNLTDYTGSIELVKDYAISTNSSITQNWQVKVYLYDTVGLPNISNTVFDSEMNVEEHDPCWNPETSTDIILCHNGGQALIEAKAEPDFTQVADTNEGMFATTDTYGTAYYYRGAVDNNWLYYNGIYWRIVSIAGNGAIKLLYSGTTAPTSATATVMTGEHTEIGEYAFNSTYNNNAYVGYMYTLNQRQGLGTSSLIKTTLDNWYTTNMNGVDSQIVDNIFCYDRSLAKSGYQSSNFGSANGSYTGTGTGTVGTLYGTAARITASSSRMVAGGTGPDIMCPSKTDAYTAGDTTNGNGALSKKVGLLTADEAVMAGLAHGTRNSTTYLYTNRWYWLGSPFGFGSNSTDYARVWGVDPTGNFYDFFVSATFGVRPAVYLTSNIVLSGTGEWNDVYKIN